MTCLTTEPHRPRMFCYRAGRDGTDANAGPRSTSNHHAITVRKLCLLAASAIVVTSLFGCATPVEPKAELKHSTLIEKRPLTVGMYYGQRLRTYTYSTAKGQIELYEFDVKLGPPSMAMFDHVMREMFTGVTALHTRRPALGKSAPVSAIIEPRILDYRYSFKLGQDRIFYGATITYQIISYAPDGTELDRWSVTGRSRQSSWGFVLRQAAATKSAQGAIGAAAAKILAEFQDRPAIKRLLKEGQARQ
jgi:hypothetical protein